MAGRRSSLLIAGAAAATFAAVLLAMTEGAVRG
jgi:hypothetical protein